jgi:hypothetical protein
MKPFCYTLKSAYDRLCIYQVINTEAQEDKNVFT